MARRRSEAGFTLLEVVSVAALLAIVAVFVVHGAGRLSPSLAARSETSRVMAAVAEARGRALGEQRDVQVEVLSGRRIRVTAFESGTWVPVGATQTLRSDVSVTIDGATSGAVRFLASGRCAAPATIVVTGTEHSEEIAILASGMSKRTRR